MLYNKQNRVLPKDTDITKYFLYKNFIFSRMTLPDNRVLVQIEHCWEDGEIMDFKFEYSDGIIREGINPLHIVKIYSKQPSCRILIRDLKKFCDRYHTSKSIKRD